MNFETFGVMIDCSRNAVMNIPTVKKYIDIMAELGYNCLMLYTEDTYTVNNQPYFGHNRGRYSKEELRELDSYAKNKGIEMIPCIQTLAHLDAIFHWSAYSSVRDCGDILLCEDENTYKLIDDMFSSLADCFTSRTINIGMDEAHMLGRGRFFDKHGAQDRFDILLKHLCKVSEIAKKYGFNLLMWGDMFFRLITAGGGGYDGNEGNVPEKVKGMIPDNVNLIYWDYYSKSKENYDKRIKEHSAIKDEIWFAGGLWTWSGFAPHNTFSMATTKAAFDSCFEYGVKNCILTMWGDNGGECSKFSVLPSLFYAAELAKGNSDIEIIKKRFEDRFGVAFDDFMLLDLPLTPNGNENIINSDKYLLYNDCFMGLFDNTVREDYSDRFGKMAEKLESVKQNEYSYLFDTAAKLCRLLEKKVCLGLKTRKEYSDKDINKLRDIISEYDSVIALTEAFYETYEKQWMAENKPHGFDVQDIRLGGLMQRIKHCRLQLLRFVNGEIEVIEELEEDLLDIKKRPSGNSLEFNNWGYSVTANIL